MSKVPDAQAYGPELGSTALIYEAECASTYP